MALPSNDINDLLQRCFAEDSNGNVALRVVSAGLAADSVDATHIDWGTTGDQVNASDIPVIDTAGNFTATDIEGVLAELAAGAIAGAPTDATYIVQVASGGLSAEQALGALATGLLKNTTTTGVLSIAAEGTDYYGPGGTDIAVADGGTGASDAAGARTNLGVAASALTLTAGLGLTGGGDLSANRSFAVDINGLTADATPDGATDYVMTYDASGTTLKKVLLQNLPAAGGGETNTGANVNVAGVGVFDGKSGVELQFRGIKAASAKITVALDDTDNEIDIDVDEAELSLQNIGGLLTVAQGGTNATTASDARTSLGLAIGSDVQAYNAALASIAGLTTAADRMIYTTASNVYDVATLTSFARTLLDDTSASDARTTLELVPGTHVQAYDAELAAIAGLTSAADRLPYFTGSGTAALATFTAFARSILDDADEATFKATVNLEIGTDVQAYDADLAAIAGISPTNDDIIQRKAGAWTNRTMAQLKTDLALVKGDVGLGNVDNTSDATKNAATATLTNKRITPRVTTEASSATPTINTDNSDMHSITALAAAITSMTTNLSGTPTDGQKLIIRIKDNGTARAITWGASFEAKGVALPTTTVLSKVLTVGFIYDSVTSKWGCVASAQEA